MAQFILFQGRLLNTAQIITVAPPRPDGGKHIIEARVIGGVSYTEEFEDDDEAAGRYLSLAASLLEDPSIAAQVARAPEPAPLAGVTPLLRRRED